MGASVVDSLVVELGIDDKAFKKGMRDSLADLAKAKDQGKKHTREIEDSTKNSLMGLEKVATTAFGLFAAFTAGRGIKDFAVAMTNINANIGRTSYTLDTNVKELGKWRNAVRLVGGDADAFTNSVAGIVGQFQQFAITGEAGGSIAYFRALGVQLSDTEGNMRPFPEWILDVADKLSAMDPAKAAAWGRSLVLDPGTVNLAIHGRQKVLEYLEAVKNYGPTDEDAKAAQNLQMAYTKWDEASSRLGITLMTRFTPAIEGVAKLMKNFSDWLDANPNTLTAIAVGLGAIGTAITVGLSASALGVAINGLKTIFGLFAATGAVAVAGSAAEIAAKLRWQRAFGIGGAAAAGTVAKKSLGRALWPLAALEIFSPGAKYEPDNPEWHKQQLEARGGDPSGHPKGPLWYFFHDLFNGKSKDAPANEAQFLLDRLGSVESNGRYDALYGGGSFSDYSQFPQWSGKMGPAGMSHAAGKYQFQPGTWGDAQKALGLKDFSPASQDQAAWWLAQRDYAKSRPGRDLLADLRSGNPALLADVGSALHGTWAAAGSGLLGGMPKMPATGALGAPTAALAGSAMTSNKAYDLSKETHIGTVNVNASNAHDSASTWQSIGGAVDNFDMATMANTGPQ